MPSGFAALDTGFPNLNGYNSTEEKLKAMEDYLTILLEQLRYTLHNLGVENLNTPEVTGWLGEVITEPIQAEIIDVENDLSTRISANAEAISTEVGRATGAESLIQQSADAIKAQVTDAQGNYTVLNLNSDGLHVGNAAGTVTISGGSITAGTVGTTQIAGGAITTGKLAANAVTANEIASNAVTTDKLNANAVTTAKLAAGAVTATEIAANAVTTAKIAAGAVTATEIAASTITAAEIATGAITTAKIAAGAVTANEIAANTITAAELSANALNGYHIYGAYYHDLDGHCTMRMIGSNSYDGKFYIHNSHVDTTMFEVDSSVVSNVLTTILKINGADFLKSVYDGINYEITAPDQIKFTDRIALGAFTADYDVAGYGYGLYGTLAQRDQLTGLKTGQLFFVI